MKLISFDVGIKNMAYCIFNCDDNKLIVQDWNVINLLEEPKKDLTCNFEIKSKKETKLCNKKAKYEKNGYTFCETHAKMAVKLNNWFFPSEQFKRTKLNKCSKADLYTLGQSYQMFDNIPQTKKECISIIQKHISERCLEKIKKIKTKTANDTDLISVGKKLKEALNSILSINEITHVIIENQISKIASRMKTVQGMLSQYFIMSEVCPYIEYVSSSNKLKDFVSYGEENSYKQHKKDSVIISNQFILNNDLGNWNNIFSTSKKDDLADAFLQGLWYLKREKIISYAENLKINCITLS